MSQNKLDYLFILNEKNFLSGTGIKVGIILNIRDNTKGSLVC